MRFTSFIVAGVFALTASAQSSTGSASSTVASAATGTSASLRPTDSAQAAIYDCLKKCGASDVDCQAHCITVPSPDTTAVNKTTECVAQCPQGNGTAAENDAYGTCVDNCINQYYYSTSVGTPSGTAGAGSGSSGSASVTAITSVVTSGSSTFTTTMSSTVKASGSSTATGSSASASGSGNAAADSFRPVGSSVGLLGFVVAMLAL